MLTITSDSISDEGVIGHVTPKRKRKIIENIQARNVRERDRQRLQEQAERRRVLQQRFEQQSGGLVVDSARLIINIPVSF